MCLACRVEVLGVQLRSTTQVVSSEHARIETLFPLLSASINRHYPTYWNPSLNLVGSHIVPLLAGTLCCELLDPIVAGPLKDLSKRRVSTHLILSSQIVRRLCSCAAEVHTTGLYCEFELCEYVICLDQSLQYQVDRSIAASIHLACLAEDFLQVTALLQPRRRWA